MKMVTEAGITDLPWYADLLGEPPSSQGLRRFSREFDLEDWDGQDHWIESPQGVSVCIRDGAIAAFIFHVAAQHGYTGFQGTLPFGLLQGMIRDEVLAHLGPPTVSRVSRPDSVLPQVYMDFYDLGAAELIVETNTTDRRLGAVRLQLPMDNGLA